MRKVKKESNFKLTLRKLDKGLLILTLIMFIFGLFMIYDASSNKSFMEYGTNSKFFIKQLVSLGVGFVLTLIILKLNLKFYKDYYAIINFLMICALVFLLIFAPTVNGAKSWLYFGSLSIQPSEFAKIVLIIYTAVYYGKNNNRIKELFYTYLKSNRLNKKALYKGFIYSIIPLIVSGIYFILIYKEPDLGTAAIIIFISLFMFFINKIPRIYKLFVILLGIIMVCGFLLFGGKFLNSMQKDRLTFRKPCTRYQENTGYQVCNGFIAINNGKLFSLIPGNSVQKYLYLPEAYTDFIFPIIVEDLGLVAGIFVILFLLLIIYRIIVIGNSASENYQRLLCYGIAFYIFLHTTINLVGVFGLLPLTGVPLPFLSYGGSFTLSLCVSLAIVQKIAAEREINKRSYIMNDKNIS